VSQDVDRVSLVETDSESGDGGIEMIFVICKRLRHEEGEKFLA